MNIKELFKDALPLISKFAPSVGGAIGGPLGIAAGYVIPLLANAFDTKPTDIPALVSKIMFDADAKSKLQGIETEHGDWICAMQESMSKLTKAEVTINLEWQR